MTLDNTPFPDVVRIESSGVCNFRCIHCSSLSSANKRNLLLPDDFFHLIEKFQERSFIPRVVVLYHGGEPLLNKYLPLYIKHLKQFGVKKTVITTNCSLLDSDMARALLLAGLDEMKVSFDGDSAEENDSIRVNGSFFDDAGRVLSLLKLKKEFRLSLPAVKICNTRISSKEVVQGLMREGEVCFEHLPRYLLSFFGEYYEDVQFISSPARMWPGYGDDQALNVIQLDKPVRTYCDQMFETVTILANGDVVPCCDDINGSHVLGNAFNESIFDIWRDAHSALRRKFVSGELAPLCKKCGWLLHLYLAR